MEHRLCLCLQGTYFKASDTPILRGCTIYSKDDITSERAKGGIAVFVSDAYLSSAIPLDTDLQSCGSGSSCGSEDHSVFLVFTIPKNW